jgi:hypothetical protein
MSIDHLQKTLRDLQARVDASGEGDAELQSLLLVLEDDIQHLLDSQRGAQEPSLADKAQELSAKFAAQHPQLEALLRELATILENMGI